MSKSNKIKSLLAYTNITSLAFSQALGLSKPQALNTKYARESFTSDDLIKLAELTDTRLCFVDNKTNKEIVSFDETDLKENQI